MKTSRIVLLSAVLVGLFAVAQKALSQTPIAVDPKATYLLTHDDAGVNAIPIPLASLGIAAGDSITAQILGDFSFCFPTGCPEIQAPACGVFSSTLSLARTSPFPRKSHISIRRRML